MSEWVSSTLVFVRDVDKAIAFYVDGLNFTLNMRHEEDGDAVVAGVSRGEGCSLLLSSQWPEKVGTGIIYTSLTVPEFEDLRSHLISGGIDPQPGWWGTRLMIVEDLDGNQLYFPVPEEIHSS